MTGRTRRPVGFGPRFVVPVVVGPLLNPINTTMIAVALVPIARELHVRSAVVIWLVASLYLVSAVAQPVMGTLADRYGPRRVYLTGLVVVLAGGLLPLAAPTFGGLLVARGLIGAGTSAAYPAAMTLIRSQSARLGRPTPPALLSGVSIASLTSAAVGPLLGGLLVEYLGWRWVFLVNVPLALFALVVSIAWLPGDRDRPVLDPVHPRAGRIDLPGIVLFAATLTTLLVFLLDLAAERWWLLAAVAVLGAALVRRELAVADPFVDLRTLGRRPELARTFLRLFLVYVAMYAMLYGFSQWLQGAAGYGADRAGLLQMPTAVLAALASVAVSRATRLRLPLVLSGALPCLGGVLVLVMTSASPVWYLLLVAAMFGVPQGLASVANQAALYRQAPAKYSGPCPGCRAPRSTSARSSPPRSSGWSSVTGPPTPGCTCWAGSSSSRRAPRPCSRSSTRRCATGPRPATTGEGDADHVTRYPGETWEEWT